MAKSGFAPNKNFKKQIKRAIGPKPLIYGAIAVYRQAKRDIKVAKKKNVKANKFFYTENIKNPAPKTRDFLCHIFLRLICSYLY